MPTPAPMRQLRVRPLTIVGALLLSGIAALACEDAPAAPAADLRQLELTRPRPLPHLEAVPLAQARFAVRARDVRYAAGDVRANIQRLETTLATRGGSSIDLFGVAAAGAGPDGAWRLRGDALHLRDLVLGGTDARATLLPARLTFDLPGGRRLPATVRATATRDANGTINALAGLSLGVSALSLAAELRAADDWTVRALLDPLALADAHTLLAGIPARGVARGTLLLQRRGAALHASTDRVVLATDSSRLVLSGFASHAGERWSLREVVLALEPVHPGDWRAWLGSEPPIDAPLVGELRADGDGRTGIALDGRLRAANDSTRIAGNVEGTLWLEPALRADVRLHIDSLRHPLFASLPDSIAALLGRTGLVVDAAVDAGAGQALGTVQLVDSTGRAWLTLQGTIPLDSSGVLDASARADSLPLALLPLPERIRTLGGFARVRAHARGSLAAPVLEGEAEILGLGRIDLPEYGTSVDSIRLRLRLAGDAIELTDVRAFHDAGALELTGGIRLSAPLDLRDPARAFADARIDVAAHLDTMTIADMDSARAVVAGDFTVTGALSRPHVAGVLDVVDGFVYEGRLAPKPPLDPADPPYSDLIAHAPWPDGRLTAALRANANADANADADAHGEATATPTLPLTADVRVTVSPDFRIVDEDSDLGAAGALRVVVDERGVFARGDARIVDGFYAYYGELFQLVGGAFSVEGTATGLAMSGVLRDADRPLGVGQGGYPGLDRRDPPIGIFGYSTRATVLELLRRRAPLPAAQAELASLLLFDVPLQPIDAFDHELTWRDDRPGDLVGQRSSVQGAGLAWSYFADELYDWIPLERGYLRAGTVRIGSRHPGWLMLGTQLDAGAHVGPRLTAHATYVVDGGAWPGVGLRYALREESLEPADRHVELFNEPRFSTTPGAGARDDFDARRRTGVRLRWLWDY